MSADRKSTVRIGTGIALILLASAFLVFEAIVHWFFRDGMGPDSITSHGVDALSRFWSDFWTVYVFVASVCAFSLWLIWPALEREKEQRGPSEKKA